jgi:hemolysin III
MSTIYHALKKNLAKRVFRILDHCTIYLLIAGTYIPIVLVGIGGVWGWTFFGVVTGAAVLGIVLNAVNVERFRIFSMICYIAMGWVIVFGFRPLANALAKDGIVLLITGGIVYTLGAILYGIGKKKKYLHSIWHFFVLGGSVLHFIVIYGYVL